MNLQRGDAGIGWTDATHNVITGCLHGCPYCYARKMAGRFGRSFAPMFHEERLAGPGKRRGALRIFEGSTSDVFGEWVPVEWIEQVLEMARAADWHTWQFLTKNPQRLAEFEFPAGAWVGTSVTNGSVTEGERIDYLRAVDGVLRFLCFEPLLGDVGGMALDGIGLVIVGPMTSGFRASAYGQPERGWVEWILEKADDEGVPVFMKKALRSFVEEWGLPWRREFPNV